MARDNSLAEDEIIDQAIETFGADQVELRAESNLLSALETFHGHGASDESSGDVDTFYHFYRVHRWIVTTDSQGFCEIETYDSEDEAHKAFAQHEGEYEGTFVGDHTEDIGDKLA